MQGASGDMEPCWPCTAQLRFCFPSLRDAVGSKKRTSSFFISDAGMLSKILCIAGAEKERERCVKKLLRSPFDENAFATLEDEENKGTFEAL